MIARTRFAALAAIAVALSLGCGKEDNPPSTSSNRGDLRVEIPGQEEAVRQGDFSFGEVAVGQSKRVTFVLVNVGSDLARITATRFEDAPAGTFFVQAPAEVGANAKANLVVTFAPTQPGAVAGRMIVEHNGTSISVDLNLSGTGT